LQKPAVPDRQAASFARWLVKTMSWNRGGARIYAEQNTVPWFTDSSFIRVNPRLSAVL
jgi:hypothetical protein